MEAKFVYPETDKKVEDKFLEEIYICLGSGRYKLVAYTHERFLVIDIVLGEIVAELLLDTRYRLIAGKMYPKIKE